MAPREVGEDPKISLEFVSTDYSVVTLNGVFEIAKFFFAIGNKNVNVFQDETKGGKIFGRLRRHRFFA